MKHRPLERRRLQGATKTTEKINIADVINKIGREVNLVLSERRRQRYFDNIVLLYSFIENLLKWLIFVEICWEKCRVVRLMNGKEVESIEKFCRDLSFYNSLQIVLLVDLVDFELYQKIDKIRRDRNDLVHQLWIYRHRKDFRQLRKRLEDLTSVADRLVHICNKLVEEIGMANVWDISLAKPPK